MVILSPVRERGDAVRFERAGFSACPTKPVMQGELNCVLAAL
ncbi:MAG TPA: hypothetical protein P5308_10220 [Syntrophales bacterium]|nr:hypothetical protein [Syntrophales bacterium]